MNFNDVMDRVAIVIEKDTGLKPYDRNIADAIGMSAPQYSSHKKRNAIPFRNIAEFCAKNNITINWVLYEQSSQKLVENDDEIFKIKRLRNINASGGAGAYNYDDEDYEYIYLDKKSANCLGIFSVKNIEAINLIGDSMYPTLKDKSIILIDKNQTNLTGSGIYVVGTTNGLFVKRLSINPNGGIDLISDNKNYPVFTIPFAESRIVGKVVGSLESV
jgi:phage repressor protein C with HTH and peptisase S24 domain